MAEQEEIIHLKQKVYELEEYAHRAYLKKKEKEKKLKESNI
jgi:hypothetical protein